MIMAESSKSVSDSPKTVRIYIGAIEFVSSLPSSYLATFENNLLNELTEKDRQLSEAQEEIAALKTSIQKLTEDLKSRKEELSKELQLYETKDQDLQKAKDNRSSTFRSLSKVNRFLSDTRKEKEDLETKLRLAQVEKAYLEDTSKELENSISLDRSGVDYFGKQNQELMKQLDICKNEKSELASLHRQKVADAEKLEHTALELEKAFRDVGVGK